MHDAKRRVYKNNAEVTVLTNYYYLALGVNTMCI